VIKVEKRKETIEWIRTHVGQGDRLVVALSGGPDSILLLDLVCEALEKSGDVEGGTWEWIAVHLNHGLRSVADQEEADLKAYCRDRGIALITKKVDCAAYAKAKRLTLEEAGRLMRYAFFREVLGDQKGWIATGHHKNDRAETVLFHLFRGAGARGLRGIPPLDPPMIRPLFNWSREEILQACQDLDLPYFIDQSNLDTAFTRNWIRHDLLPRIESKFDSGVVDRIVRTSDLIAADDAFLFRLAKETFSSLAKWEGAGLSLDREALKALDAPMLSRVLLIALDQAFATTKDVDHDQISRAMALIRTGHSGRVFEFSKGRRFEVGAKSIYFGQEARPEAYAIPLSVPGVTRVPGGQVRIDWKRGGQVSKDPFTIDMDYDKIQGRLFWRSQKQGDGFDLAGGRGTKRLKRFWIDQKIPVHQRDTWPLVADSCRILWVVGLRKCVEKPREAAKAIRITVQVFEGGHHEK
jgi:tRNA(Ile)-lysidine synthase